MRNFIVNSTMLARNYFSNLSEITRGCSFIAMAASTPSTTRVWTLITAAPNAATGKGMKPLSNKMNIPSRTPTPPGANIATSPAAQLSAYRPSTCKNPRLSPGPTDFNDV